MICFNELKTLKSFNIINLKYTFNITYEVIVIINLSLQ